MEKHSASRYALPFFSLSAVRLRFASQSQAQAWQGALSLAPPKGEKKETPKKKGMAALAGAACTALLALSFPASAPVQTRTCFLSFRYDTLDSECRHGGAPVFAETIHEVGRCFSSVAGRSARFVLEREGEVVREHFGDSSRCEGKDGKDGKEADAAFRFGKRDGSTCALVEGYHFRLEAAPCPPALPPIPVRGR